MCLANITISLIEQFGNKANLFVYAFCKTRAIFFKRICITLLKPSAKYSGFRMVDKSFYVANCYQIKCVSSESKNVILPHMHDVWREPLRAATYC